MVDFCEFTLPDSDCASLVAYVKSLVTTAKEQARIAYASGTADATDDQLNALWGECDPPDCAVVVWFNTTTETFEVWSYINSTWRQTGSATNNTPYYTEFAGVGGPVQEGWSGDWRLNGSGRIYPVLTYGDELVLNGGFEAWTGTVPDDWTETGPAGATQESTVVYEGQYSALIPGVGAPPANTIYQDITVDEGRWFLVAAALYNTVTVSPSLSTNNGLSVALSTANAAWTPLSRLDYSLTTTKRITIAGGLAAIVGGYADAVSMVEVSGWNITKEFYSPYGTLYADIVLETGTVSGILLNYQDDDNYAMVVRNTATIWLIEVTAGAAAITNSWASAYVAGARLEVLRDSSDDVTIDYNGGNIVTGQALASPIALSTHGLVGTSENNYFTAFGYTPE